MKFSEAVTIRIRLMFYSFLIFMVYAFINPHIAILFYLKEYSVNSIGLLMGLFFCAGIFGPLQISKYLQSYPNYRRVLAIIMLLCSLIFYVLGVNNFLWLSFFIIFGFGLVYHSLAPLLDMTYVSTLYNPHKYYGLVRSLGTLGFVIASLIIPIFKLVDINSQNSILIGCMAILVVGIFITLVLVPKTHLDVVSMQKKKQSSFFKSVWYMPKEYFLLLFIFLFNQIGLIVVSVFLPLLVKEVYNFSNVTTFSVVSALSEMIIIYYGNQIVQKVGYARCLLLIVISTVVRLLLLGVSHSLIVVYFTQMFHMGGYGLMLSVFIYFINHQVEQEHKSILMGLNQAFISLANIIGSVVGGIVLQFTNYNIMFFAMTIFPLIGLGCVLIGLQTLRRLKVKFVKV